MKQPDVIAGSQFNDVLINARSISLEKQTVTRLVRKYTPLPLLAFYKFLKVTIRFYLFSSKIITSRFLRQRELFSLKTITNSKFQGILLNYCY